MGFSVKITTLTRPLDLCFPYSCRGCGGLGEAFCKCCRKNIKLYWQNVCPRCRKPSDGYCCGLWAFNAGWRDDFLGRLVEEYKYQSVKGLGRALAEVLDGAITPSERLIGEIDSVAVLSEKLIGEIIGATVLNEKITREIVSEAVPCLNDCIVVVPLPTIRRHVRQRGLDHTFEIAKYLARRRGWRVEKNLGRESNSVQVGADRETRKEQANKAYKLDGAVDKDKIYLLVDDVWTTGASMEAAIAVLQKAGVKKIITATLVISR